MTSNQSSFLGKAAAVSPEVRAHSESQTALSCFVISSLATSLFQSVLMDVGTSEADTSRASKRLRGNYLLGVGLLLVVVFLWTISSFITQVRGVNMRRLP